MKSTKVLFVSALFATSSLVVTPALAQKGKKSKPASSSSGNSNPFGNSGSTDPFGGASSGNQPPAKPAASNGGTKPTGTQTSTQSSADPFASSNAQGGGSQPPAKPATGGGFNKNLPITVQKSAGGDPLTDTIKPNLRNPSSITSATKDRIPLDWDFVREDDAVYRHKIWEVVDAREKINLPFVYKEDEGNNLFFTILVRAILEDSVAAFEHYDFRKELTKKEIKSKCTGGWDTAYQYDLDGNIVGLSVGKKEFPIDSVNQFQIMEEVFFDKESSKMLRRIIGIAPMGPLVISGKVVPGQNFPYFWVYYQDIRKVLAKRQVYNPKNLNSNQTWEDFLESHQYSYYITKTTMDNHKDIKLLEKVGNDKMFSLYKGEEIKTSLFNYEQSLWAY